MTPEGGAEVAGHLPAPAEILVAGSIARDRLEGPFGLVEEELGGSAMYFALAASLLVSVRLVAPVGQADEAAVRAVLNGRPVDLDGLSVLPTSTYRWHARQVEGVNLDLGSRDAIYDAWVPRLPAGYSGWAFIGSMRPDRQLHAARELRPRATLLAADAMQSYVTAAPAEAASLLDLVDWYFANQGELAALDGDPADPDAFRRVHNLAGLVVKRGPDGVSAYTASGTEHLPAGPADVVDTTGAGDALAGGMLAAWVLSAGTRTSLRDALRHGLAAAALAIEEVGLGGLTGARGAALAARLASIA